MVTLAVLLALAFSLVHAPAHGQGFGIYEHGACVMARAAAGVAQPCDDGSAIAVNPAGIAGRQGSTLGTGGMLVFGSGGFTDDTGVRTSLERLVSLVPYGYFVYGTSSRLAFGIGGYVPYGLAVKWPVEFDGRFVSFDSTLETFYLQPTVAYALNRFVSVGGGPTIALSSVELNRREDLAMVPLGATGLSFGALVDERTDFATTSLAASRATGLGLNAGALVTVSDRMRIGARYLTSVKLSYDGDATFTPVTGGARVTKDNPLGLPIGTPLDALVAQVMASLPNQQASTELEMPAQFVVGASLRATPRLTVLADYQWVGWSVFDIVTLDFDSSSTPDESLVQNYRDTSAVRLGGEFEVTPEWRLRGGYAHTQAAAPDETVTPLLPEAQRNHVTVGVGWRPRPRMTIDLAYQFVGHADRRGRTVNPPRGVRPTAALNSGVYHSRGDLLGLTMTFRR